MELLDDTQQEEDTTPDTYNLHGKEIQLTPDQKVAMAKFWKFYRDPNEVVFVLGGFSGCGKSTLVTIILDQIEKISKALTLINPKYRAPIVELTATTNKAAENLAQITGMDVKTIHSVMGLRVNTDYVTGKTEIRTSYRPDGRHQGKIFFIDEASFVDRDLLEYTFQIGKGAKFVFIGDPAQLSPINSIGTPVFEAGFDGATLTQVVRQAEGNPIIDLSTKFRNTVNTGEFFQFKPDGHHVVYLDRPDFEQAILDEFTRPDWRYNDSKILAWTNKRVVAYNAFVRSHAKGEPTLQDGDYALVNNFVSVNKVSLKTDQLVQITNLAPGEKYGIKGRYVTCDHKLTAFFPDNLFEAKEKAKAARKDRNYAIANEIEQEWIDLRAAYACTINKSQGSTYDQVFIDLDDVSRCNSGDQIARMLYVAVSRARTKVYLTGDLA